MAEASDTAQRLVETGLDLVRKEGFEALTLRRIAREAGVSHGAPLRHFASLNELRAAVASYGFQDLDEALRKAAASLPPGSDPIERLGVAGRAYVDCALSNPGMFGLMFRPELLDPEQARFLRYAPAAFEQLVTAVRAAQDAGYQPTRDTRALAGALWAAVHGLVSLWSQGALSATTGASLDDLLDATLATWVPPTP